MSDKKKRVAKAAKERVEVKLGDIWWSILLRGVLALALAVCAFGWPEQTLGLMIKLLGAYFLIDGVVQAITAYRSDSKSTPLVQAIVSLAIGCALFLWTGVSGKVFLILVGIWLALQGIGLLVTAFRSSVEDPSRTLAMGVGAAITVVGVVFVAWPESGMVAISWMIGLGALVVGLLLVFLATRVRKMRVTVQQIGQEDDSE